MNCISINMQATTATNTIASTASGAPWPTGTSSSSVRHPSSTAKARIARASCTERTRAKATLQQHFAHHHAILRPTLAISSLPASSNTQKRHRLPIKKSVRFAGTIKVCMTQVTEEDLNLTWYGPREYKGFQRDSKRSLKAVSSNLRGQVDAYDVTQHCHRGLEACVSNSIYQSRKEEKSAIINQVLQQQLFQRILGVNDQESLAKLSKDLSKNAQERALVLAAIDSARDSQGEVTAL